MRPQIIETIGQRERLRIGHALAHFLRTAVDITAMHVDLLDDLALERGTEAQYAMRRRVLGADVDHILLFVEKHMFSLFDLTVLELVAGSLVLGRFIGLRYRIDLRVRIVILAERIADPVVAQVQPAHIGMARKPDAVEVVYFTLVQVGRMPQVAYTGQNRMFTVGRLDTQHHFVAQRSRTQVVHHTEGFAPVGSGHANQKIELRLTVVAQHLRHGVEILRRNRHGQHFALFHRRGGSQCQYLILYQVTHCRLLPVPFPSTLRASSPCGSHRRRSAAPLLCAATASCRTTATRDAGDTPAHKRPPE